MKSILLIIITMITISFSGTATVYKTGVCGADNMIAETSSGDYVIMEWFGGREFDVGDVIYGDFTSFGFHDVYGKRGTSGRYWIEDYWLSLEDAYEQLCD